MEAEERRRGAENGAGAGNGAPRTPDLGSPNGSAAEKRAIRSTVRASRAAMTSAERDLARAAITRHLIALVTKHGARSLSCYLPTANEPDPSDFLAWAHTRGIDVFLPVSQADRTLSWSRQTEARPEAGRHGILEPTGARLPTTAAASLDLMFVPACAVDTQGVRLGWGLGYYDRSLAALPARPPVFAIAFDADVFRTLPREAHDVPMTGVVTESGARVFAEDAVSKTHTG